MNCSKCGIEINEGFYCVDSNKVWCDKCHSKLDIEKYCGGYYQLLTDEKKQGTYKVHEHIRWVGNIHNRPELIPIDVKVNNPKLDSHSWGFNGK